MTDNITHSSNGKVEVAYWQRKDGTRRTIYSWQLAEAAFERYPNRITWNYDALISTGRFERISRRAMAGE